MVSIVESDNVMEFGWNHGQKQDRELDKQMPNNSSPVKTVTGTWTSIPRYPNTPTCLPISFDLITGNPQPWTLACCERRKLFNLVWNCFNNDSLWLGLRASERPILGLLERLSS